MKTKESINEALKILGLNGMSGVETSAPTTLLALGKIIKKSPAYAADHKRLLQELKRQALVHISQDGQSYKFTLTPAGLQRLQKVYIDDIAIRMPSRWDKKWRIVTFDVPVNQSKQRKYFTAQLQRLGFMMLQKSMWVHPYPCFDQIEELAGYYNVLRYCILMEVSQLDELTTRKLVRSFPSL